uniref:SH2 domain-containing protein n=1 Tax=Cyclopterus lumpus TaxID=8103 RepID=A0A8C2W906_CYCLU
LGPFEDALKLHEACGGAAGSAAGVGGVRVLEDQWPSPPRRRAPVAPNEEQLRREAWYHSRMSRRDAEKLLVRDGDFLVRESTTNPGQYVLTGMHCGLPKHLLLVDPEGVVSKSKSSVPKNTKVHTIYPAWKVCVLCSKHNNFCSLLSSVQVRTKDMLFESISHLISYHLQNELPIVAAESELHLKQVVRRKQ